MSIHVGPIDVFALAAMHAEMAQQDRDAARLAAREREKEQVSMLRAAARELEDAATMTLCAGLARGGAQIGGGVLQIGGGVQGWSAVVGGAGEGIGAGFAAAGQRAQAHDAEKQALAKGLEHAAGEQRTRERDAADLRRSMEELIADRARRDHDVKMRILEA